MRLQDYLKWAHDLTVGYFDFFASGERSLRRDFADMVKANPYMSLLELWMVDIFLLVYWKSRYSR